ncbi:MAG: serine/threonine-protein kinase, partial [Myxococcota bacterium]
MTNAERLGRYRIGERIGQGGVAEVFRAEVSGAEGFSKTVAIKRVRAEVASDSAAVEGFLAEAELARRLAHGNIVQIHDVGVEEELPYLVMEHIDGMALGDLVHASGPLPVADALHVTEQICAALDYAHGLTDDAGRPCGIAHRDVHPRNILVSLDGVVKLTDFGIAKSLHAPDRTVPGLIKGTLGYLAPEQIRGDTTTAAADQFAVGVVLYEMLTGANPLTAAGDIVEYGDQLADGLPRLSAPAPADDELADIIARAVTDQPGDRFPSVADLRAELEHWRVTRRIRVSPEGLGQLVRNARGTSQTVHHVYLDDMLADQLDATKNSQTQVTRAVADKPRARWLPRAALGLLIAVAAALAYAMVGPFPGDAPSSSEAIADNSASPATRDRANPVAQSQDQKQGLTPGLALDPAAESTDEGPGDGIAGSLDNDIVES